MATPRDFSNNVNYVTGMPCPKNGSKGNEVFHADGIQEMNIDDQM